jgi:hypothetical protein
MGEFAKYVAGKSGGMGEVVSALCRGLWDRGIPTYIVTLNLKRRFMEKSGIDREEYIKEIFRVPHDHIKMIDSAILKTPVHTTGPEADGGGQRIRQTLIKEIISNTREGISPHDWMAGDYHGILQDAQVPVLHTVHNAHTDVPWKCSTG